MRTLTQLMLFLSAAAILSFFSLVTGTAFANTTITLDQPVHFTTIEGSDVVLDAGDYEVAAADEWLRVTPSEGQAVDALLLEAQVAKHEEALKAPLGNLGSGRIARYASSRPPATWWQAAGSGWKRLEAIVASGPEAYPY